MSCRLLCKIWPSRRRDATGSDKEASSAVAQSSKLSNPRRCKRLEKIHIPSDHDIWVERSYRNVNGRKVHYYCSVNDIGRKQLFEPPTGASLVVREFQHA